MALTNKAEATSIVLAKSSTQADIALRNQVFIESLKASEAKQVASFLKQIDTVIRKALSGDNLTEYKRERLERLLDDVDDKLKAIDGEFWTKIKASAKETAVYQASFEAKTLGSIIVDFQPKVPTALQIAAALKATPLSVTGPDGGKLLQAFVRDWSVKNRKAVTNAIRLGVFQGQTNAEIVRTIRGTKAMRYKDGILATTDRQARGVVNTAVQHASTVGRMETARANADVVKAAEWLATLDAHTCATCRSLDHRQFPIDKGPRPPIHINDRCTILLVTADWVELEKTLDRPAVVNGKVQHVPADMDYYAWLKTQSAAFQDKILGPTRAKLFRDGGLSAKRFSELMLDRRWKPLTLSEIKALDPIAWGKAGL